MPTYSIKAPNGRTYEIEGPDGASQSDVIAQVLQQHPDAGTVAKPKSGFLPAAKAGFEHLKGDVAGLLGRTGIMDVNDAKKYQADTEAEANRIYAPTAKGWTEAPLTKIGELAGGSLPYMAAPLAAGAGAGALGLGALGAGAAAGAASLGQFTGSNLSRQVNEGTPLEKTNLQSAALAAVPQAALDIVGFKMIPGIRNMFKAAGKELSVQQARAIAQQGLKATLADYGASTLKAMGTEGVTEAGQQVFERLQAGLKLEDPQARDEYLQSFIGGVALGGVLSPAGRYAERGKLKEKDRKNQADAAEADAIAAQEALTAQQAQQEAQRKDPAYAKEVADKYRAAEEQFKQMTPVKPAKEAGAAEWQKYKTDQEAIKQFDAEVRQPLAAEFNATQGAIPKPTPTPEALQVTPTPLSHEDGLFADLPPGESQAPVGIPTAEEIETKRVALIQQSRTLQDHMEQMRDVAAKAAKSGDIVKAMDAARMFRQAETASAEATKALGELPSAPKQSDAGAQLKKAQEALARAAERGDIEGIEWAVKKIQKWTEAGGELIQPKSQETMPMVPTGGKSEAKTDFMGRLMADGREQAANQRQQTQAEIDAIRQQRERSQAPEYAMDARKERGTQLEINQMEAARMNPERTDQLSLLDPVAPNTTRTVQGAGTADTKTRAELVQEFNAARATGNKQAAREAVERIRDMNARDNSTPPKNKPKKLMATRAASQLQPSTETSYPTEAPTAMALRKQIAQLPENLDPEDNALVQRVMKSLPVIGSDPQRRMIVGEYLHKLGLGPQVMPSGEPAAPDNTRRQEVASVMDQLDQGKRSESEQQVRVFQPRERMEATDRGPKKTGELLPEKRIPTGKVRAAIQTDAFPDEELHGAIFNSYPEFEAYLASDALQESRSAMGLALETLAHARKRVAPMQQRAAELRQDLTNMQTLLAQQKKVQSQAVSKAVVVHEAALARAQKLYDQIEAQLGPWRAEVTKAQEALAKAADKVSRISDTIAKNAAKFNRDAKVVAAASKVAEAKDAYANAAKQADGFDNLMALTKDMVKAINAHRAAIEANAADSQKVSEKAVLDFLNKDMELMLRLQDAQGTVARLAGDLETAQAAFEMADRVVDEASTAERTQNKADVSTTRGTLTRTKATNERSVKATVSEIQDIDTEMRAITKQVDEELGPIFEQQKVRAEKLRVQPDKQAESNQRQRKANDVQQNLNALPGRRLSFEKRRKMLDQLEEAPARIEELQRKANNEELPVTTRNKAKAQAKALRKMAEFTHGALSHDPETVAQTLVSINAKLQDVLEKRDAKKIAINEGGPATTIASRKRELTALQREAVWLSKMAKGFSGRPDVTEILSAEDKVAYASDTAQQAFLERAAYIGDMQQEFLERAAAEKTKQQARLDQVDTAEDAKNKAFLEKALTIQEEGDSGRLPARKIGPVVKPTTTAGNVRTGNLKTVGERKLAPNVKATQGGDRKGITGPQAVAAAKKDTAFETAMTRLSYIEGLQERTETALENARTAGDEARVTKLEGNLERLAAEQTKAQKALDKASRDPKDKIIEEDALLQTFNNQDVTPVDTDTQEALEDGRTLHVIDGIAKNGSTPRVRELAAKLRPFLLRTSIKTGYPLVDGKSVAGVYYPERNAVVIHQEAAVEEVILHELAHAATVQALKADPKSLSADQRAARASLESLFKMIQANPSFAGEYAQKDMLEFVAEVYSNPAVQAKLDAVGKPQSLLARIRGFIARLLGFNNSPEHPDSKQTLAYIERLMKPSRPMSAPAVASVQRINRDTAAGKLGDKLIAKPTSFKERVKSHLGLSMETALVDMRAPIVKALGNSKNARQSVYYMRKADSRMAQTYAVLQNGPLQIKKDSKGHHSVEAGGGPSVKTVFESIGRLKGISEQDKMNTAQLYMIAKRADNVGVQKLDLGSTTKADLDAVVAEVDADPAQKAAMQRVRDEYHAFNTGLINFLSDSGALPKKEAARLLSNKDFIPYYRVRADGVAELVFDETNIMTVGDLRHQPYLRELKGGDAKLLPFNESIVRNTMLLTDMGMRNLASKSIAYTLQDIGAEAKKMKVQRGKGPANAAVIRFKQEPDARIANDDGDRFIQVDTEGTAASEVPADMLAQSIEGAHVTLPAFLKVAGWFGDVLRAGVTRSPIYVARQLFRDPFAASFTAGIDAGPLKAVAKAAQLFGKQSLGDRTETSAALLRKGVVHSGIFTGDPDDMAKMALQLAGPDNQSAMNRLFAMADRAAMRADSVTREQVYDDAIKNGASEMEAELAAMEMMNFNKRGMSPTVQYAARMIPFFNAQIQGLNVLHKAATGQMSANDRLRIREKFFHRAMMLAGMTTAYALAMDDDDTYKNAKPRDRYGNFFVNLGGDTTIKLPIPFEVGVLFKAIPEMMVDALKGDFNEQEFLAAKTMILAQIPGAGSYGLPQMVRPALEVAMNHNLYTGRPIETAGMEKVAPNERFTARTTEMAKRISDILQEQPANAMKLSPVQIEHLTRGYLGSIPMAVAMLTNELFGKADAPEAPTRKLVDTPMAGMMFQDRMGGAATEALYAKIKAVDEAQATFNKMVHDGRKADANAYRENVLSVLQAPIMDKASAQLKALAQRERMVRMSNATAEAKRAVLDQIDTKREQISRQYLDAVKQIAQ